MNAADPTPTEVTPPPAKPRRFMRELTTLIAGPAVIWLVGWAPNLVYILVLATVASLALHEFLTLGTRKGYPVQKAVSILLMLLLLSAFVLESISVELGVFAVLLVIPAAYVFAKSELEDALPASAVCVLATLYIGMLTGALLRLRIDFPKEGPKLVFFLLIVVWIGDAGAYYIGSKFGKHRLSPRVSPKKSVEGGIGGLATSVIAAAVIHFTFFSEFPLHHALIAALILSATGVIGDLAESLWKRSAAVKDSGTLIPGHGGFLDRFDSILFTAPLLYGYWFLLTHNFRLS
jgi:phosphatidate cytidylyltransferase